LRYIYIAQLFVQGNTIICVLYTWTCFCFFVYLHKTSTMNKKKVKGPMSTPVMKELEKKKRAKFEWNQYVQHVSNSYKKNKLKR